MAFNPMLYQQGLEKQNPNLIKDGKKRVEQIAENEREKQKSFWKRLFG